MRCERESEGKINVFNYSVGFYIFLGNNCHFENAFVRVQEHECNKVKSSSCYM